MHPTNPAPRLKTARYQGYPSATDRSLERVERTVTLYRDALQRRIQTASAKRMISVADACEDTLLAVNRILESIQGERRDVRARFAEGMKREALEENERAQHEESYPMDGRD